MKDKLMAFGKSIERLGGWIISIIGATMGIALIYYSAFYTETYDSELDRSVTSTDRPWVHLLILVIFCLVMYGINKLASKHAGLFGKIEKGLLWFVLLFSFVSGGLWIAVSHVRPYADAYSICKVAECMLQGDYPMQPPAYMCYYPQQYGLVFVLQWMFALFGPGNYLPWKIMNLILFPLMIYAGYRILKLLTADSVVGTNSVTGTNSVVGIVYLLLMSCYLPFYFYVPYVYGDFPSVACGMILMWQTVSFCKKGKKSSIVIAAFAAAFGCLVRRNTLIVIIAACLVLAVVFVKTLNYKHLIMIAAMVLVTVAADRGVAAYYEHCSGQEIFPGVPPSCYVMMGLQDTEAGPGWFNGENNRSLIITDYDYEASKAYGVEQCKLRLREFWNNKAYTVDFFRRKILTQWNMPDCLSMQETAHFECKKEELPALVRNIYFEELGKGLMQFMNRYQFLLYFGFGLAMLELLFGKKRDMEFYILVAAIIGGLLFSIIWEAMSRYVLAYVGYMIPMAALGFGNMTNIRNWRKKT